MGKELNKTQKEAASIITGPLLILAGAGSGKTTTMVYRIGNMINSGINPKNILAITFTNKAAGEMKQRIKDMLGKDKPVPFVSTFHAYGFRMLISFGKALGYKDNITLLDDDASKKQLKNIITDLYGKEAATDKKLRLPNVISDIISRHKDHLETPEDAKKYTSEIIMTPYGTVFPSLVYETYEARLKEDNAVDFDDLIEKTVRLLQIPRIKAIANRRWKYICIDEYQDTSHAQAEMIELLSGEEKNVCAIGDDFQCQPAGTKVTMADGTHKGIEDIKIGDFVLSRRIDNEEYFPHIKDTGIGKEVKGLSAHYCNELISVVTTDGMRSMYTPNHRCLIRTDRNKASLTEIPADKLESGMQICVPALTEKGEYIDTYKQLVSVEAVFYGGIVYGLLIDGTEAYVADGILTHNSIYRFRGADITNILSFERAFPGCKMITLNENYRSTRHIVDGAAGVIKNNTDQYPKDLFSVRGDGDRIKIIPFKSDTDEAKVISREIASLVDNGENPNEIAILYRKNSISDIFDAQLSAEGVPHRVYGGLQLTGRKEVKDALAYLSLIAGNDDTVALERIINVPKRGIGTVKTKKILDYVREREDGVTLLERLRDFGATDTTVSEFVTNIEALRKEQDSLNLPAFINSVFDRIGLWEYYTEQDKKEEKDEDESRVNNLSALITRAMVYMELHPEFETPDMLKHFLIETLLSSDDDEEIKTPTVSLMTEHKAKGLEFKHVYIVAAEASFWKYADLEEQKADMEEERRLFYVAMTRAKDYLTISNAGARFERGDYLAKEPIPFISEIPENDTIAIDTL